MGSNLRVALCGIGIQAYWEQFSALRPELEAICKRLRLGFPDPASSSSSLV
jgi:hypothetical protein